MTFIFWFTDKKWFLWFFFIWVNLTISRKKKFWGKIIDPQDSSDKWDYNTTIVFFNSDILKILIFTTPRLTVRGWCHLTDFRMLFPMPPTGWESIGNFFLWIFKIINKIMRFYPHLGFPPPHYNYFPVNSLKTKYMRDH